MQYYIKYIFGFMLWQHIIMGNTLSDTTYNKDIVFVKGFVNQSLSRYQLKIINTDIYINKEYKRSKSEAILFDSLSSDTLSVSEFNWKTFRPESDKYEFVDINFDGYNDLLVFTGYSANGMNEEFDIYLFNIVNNHLEFNDDLSSEIGFNTMIDKELKEITTGGADGFMNYQWRTFKYINGKLLMTSVETQERLDSLDSKTNIRLYRWYKQVRENDKMVTKKEIIGTIEQIEKETR